MRKPARLWQGAGMNPIAAEPLNARLVDALYTEAMLLADEARSYFEDRARADRLALPPLARVGFACESLKVTTRLMHVIAWLLMRRAGEAEVASMRTLGEAAASSEEMVAPLPDAARALIAASSDLHARVARLERGERQGNGPARALMNRLQASI